MSDAASAPILSGALRGAGILAGCGAALAAGVLAAVPPTAGTLAVIGLFPLAGASFALARRGRRPLAAAALILAAGCAGIARGALPPSGETPCGRVLRAAGLPAPDGRAAAALDAVALVTAARLRDGNAQLDLDLVRAAPLREPPAGAPPDRVPLRLRARVLGPLPAPLPGDGVLVHLRLDEPDPGRQRRLRREGVACTGRVVGRRLAVIDPALAPAESLRRRIAGALRRGLGDGPDAGLVLALSIGDRSAIGAAQRERFTDSGLSHLVSISGLHVSLVVLGLFRLLALALARTPLSARVDPVRSAALATLPFVPAYAVLAGAEPPVVRAAVGAALFLLATVALRAAHAAASLCAAAIAVIALDPAALLDPSFQLSFAACAGLLLLAPGLRALIPIPRSPPGSPLPRRMLEAVLGAVATTAAATLATLPLTALHFQRTSLAAMPANVVALPVGLGATVASAVAALAAAVAPPLAGVAGAPAALLCGWLDAIAAFFARLPGARIALPPPGPADVAALVTAALALAGLRRRPRAALAALTSALLVIAVPRVLQAGGDGLLHVDFLPVGQGDATLLRLPEGGAILVDAGGDLRGRERGAPVLREVLALGVRSLEALVITHLHPDHAGDAPALLRTLAVRELWTSGRPLEGPLGEALAAAAGEAGVTLRALSAGAPPITVGGVTVQVLGPPDRDGLLHDPLLGENDGSLVLRVVHRDVAVLLPGDVEAAGEEALLESGRPLFAVLLKAPHHGSRTSSSQAFLEAVMPAHAVFCVGRRNLFGFPHAEVEERYRALGASPARTDAGRVSFVSDGTVLRREGRGGERAPQDAAW